MTSLSNSGKSPSPPPSHTIDAWRVFRIISELVEGFESMVSLGPSVAFFGSSRSKKNDPHYDQAFRLAEKLSKRGFGIITGGGPGLMEAVNKGAQASGKSCGLCIDLPDEEPPNAFIVRKYLLRFRYFFVRKVMFVRYAQAFVVFPGGYGTIDELFEALMLIQTKRIKPFPVFLVGKEYWSGLVHWLQKTAVEKTGYILPEEMSLFRVTEDLDEIVEVIEEHLKKAMVLENF